MAVQEIDVAIHTPNDDVTVAAADNTLSNAASLHWDDTVDKGALIDAVTKMVDAFHKHISSGD